MKTTKQPPLLIFADYYDIIEDLFKDEKLAEGFFEKLKQTDKVRDVKLHLVTGNWLSGAIERYRNLLSLAQKYDAGHIIGEYVAGYNGFSVTKNGIRETGKPSVYVNKFKNLFLNLSEKHGYTMYTQPRIEKNPSIDTPTRVRDIYGNRSYIEANNDVMWYELLLNKEMIEGSNQSIEYFNMIKNVKLSEAYREAKDHIEIHQLNPYFHCVLVVDRNNGKSAAANRIIAESMESTSEKPEVLFLVDVVKENSEKASNISGNFTTRVVGFNKLENNGYPIIKMDDFVKGFDKAVYGQNFIKKDNYELDGTQLTL